MKNIFSTDWWRWEMYRHVALFVHYPSDANQSKLNDLINEFRQHSEQRTGDSKQSDEHEYVMDYR